MAEVGQLDDVKDMLTCVICFEEFDDPVILTCFHTFCRRCIGQHVDKTGKSEDWWGDGKSHCPVCRTSLSVPSEGVAALPKNFYVNRLTEVLRNEPSVKDETCEMCVGADGEKQPAAWTCRDCSAFMCNNCHDSHTQAFRTEHAVVEVDVWRQMLTIENAKQTAICCETHRSKILKFYCWQCGIAICLDCRVEQHKGHECDDIMLAATQARRDLADIVAELRNRIEQLDAQKFQPVTDAQNKLMASRDKILHDMNEDERVVIDKVQKHFHDLRKKVENYYETLSGPLRTLLEECSSETSRLQSACLLGQNVMNHGANCEVVEARAQLSQLAATVDKTKTGYQWSWEHPSTNHMTYQPGNFDLLKSTQATLGEWAEEAGNPQQLSADMGKLSPEGSNDGAVAPHVSNFESTKSNKLVSHPHLVRCLDVIKSPTSLSISSDGKILVTGDDDAFIYFTDTKKRGHKIDPLNYSEDWTASDMVCSNDKIILVDSDDRPDCSRLLIFDHNFVCITWFDVDDPNRAAITGDGNVVVLNKGSDQDFLTIYDIHSGEQIMCRRSKSSWRDVTVSPITQDIIVTHEEGVSAFSARLLPRWTYEHNVMDRRERLYARGVCVDSSGRVLVADSNFAAKRILVLSSEGSFITHLSLEGLVKAVPWHVAVTSDGQLVVGCSKHRTLYFIKYDG